MLACFIIFTEMLVCLHLYRQLSYVYYGSCYEKSKQASKQALTAHWMLHFIITGFQIIIATAAAKISRIDDGYVFVVHSIICSLL